MKKIGLLISALLFLVASTFGQTSYNPPTVYVSSGLTVKRTAGTVNNGGKPVSVAADGTGVAVTANMNDCSAPAFAACDIVYVNSAGTVAVTTSISTAASAGNVILAYVTTGATTVSSIVFGWQNGAPWTAGGGGAGNAFSQTVSTAALGTVRALYGQVTADFAGTLTSGNIVGVRGLATIAAGTTAGSGTFIYGTQGKVTLLGVEGGADVTGIIGQLDLSAGTNTSGIISAGWFDLGATATGTFSQTSLLRVTNTTAATIQDVFHVYAKSNTLFSLENNGSAYLDASTGGSTQTGRIAITVNGAARFLHVFSD